MKYRITFHCGATMEVAEIYDDILSTRCTVWSMRKHLRPKMPDGHSASCLDCKGTRRASKRKRYECFPDDYEQEKDKAYAGKSMREVLQTVISCIPKNVERM